MELMRKKVGQIFLNLFLFVKKLRNSQQFAKFVQAMPISPLELAMGLKQN